MAANNDCFTCTQMKKKHKSSIICTGCQKRFCTEHHKEHRKSMEKDFTDLIEEHNIVRQNLYDESKDGNDRTLTLFKKIDDWEIDTMKHIKATASAARTRLREMINEEKDQLKEIFKLIANELKANQTSSDYVETELQEWKKQINKCKEELNQLSISNNNFLNIEIQSINWETILNIHRKKDIYVKTNCDKTMTNWMVSKTKLECVQCGGRFSKLRGYDERFCTRKCFDNYSDGNERFRTKTCSENVSDDDDIVCFHGNCVVLLGNGRSKFVKDIRKGDVVETPNGSKATITHAVKILRKSKKTSMVTFDNGLIITPWHPVRINGKWTFPHDIANESQIECQEVYNFALDIGHIMIINGIECATLGHGFKGEVIEHPYYGTSKVLEDLQALDISNDGLIELLPNSIIRHKETGLVSRICKHAATFASEQFSYLNIPVQ